MWFEDFFQEALPIVAAGTLLLIVATALGVLARSGGLYAALCSIIAGGVCIAVSLFEVPIEPALRAVSALAIVGGGLYLLLFLVLHIRARAASRKRARIQVERNLEYTLPDKDNSFIRERLQTALQPLKETGDGQPPQFTHAQKLLLKLQEAPLSVAERLEMENLTTTLNDYLEKERLTAVEVRVVNDLFSRLLKLSAKYSV